MHYDLVIQGSFPGVFPFELSLERGVVFAN